MSKHTPGPWFASSAYGNHAAIWIGPQEGAQMVLQGANCLRSDSVSHEQIGVDQLVANAALIAAAPELLAALNAMLTHMGMDEDEWNKPTFDQARAAIAKATGGAA